MIAIVSNMLILPPVQFVRRLSRSHQLCNMGATLCRWIGRRVIPAICVLVVAAVPAEADQSAPENSHDVADAAKFVAGAGVGFALHEAGHLLFDVVFDAQPYVKTVHFGPL